MLGVGFDAHVVHNLPFPLKKVFGKGAYVLQSLRELARYKFPPIRMRIDDIEVEAGSVIVSKGTLYGGSFLLAADAVPGEPGFSVVLFDHAGPAAALMYGAACRSICSDEPPASAIFARGGSISCRMKPCRHRPTAILLEWPRFGSATRRGRSRW